MGQLLAGFARLDLQPKIGTNLVGYGQEQNTVGTDIPIHVRTLVVSNDDMTIALCSVEVCFFLAQNVQRIRAQVAEQLPIQPENIFMFATHTHAAPAFFYPEHWQHSPEETIVKSIVTAYEQRVPAKLGVGYGQMQGYSINRRFMNRPVDPSVSVIRIDHMDDTPMGILSNHGNHAVVMGYNNQHISGDWPGYSSLHLESQFGHDFVAMFGQGGAAEVNPITETMRQRLLAGHPLEAIGETSTMYGFKDISAGRSWNIGDRADGTPIEAETLGLAYNQEVMRVWKTIKTSSISPLSVTSFRVDGTPAPDEPPIPDSLEIQQMQKVFERVVNNIDGNRLDMEIMVAKIGDATMVGHPGETFSEDAVALRKICQQNGIPHPVLVTYANGWFTYLTPENAYSEGGYEVTVAQSIGLSRYIQDRILSGVLQILGIETR